MNMKTKVGVVAEWERVPLVVGGVNAFFRRVKRGRVRDGTHLSSTYTEMMGWKSMLVLVSV